MTRKSKIPKAEPFKNPKTKFEKPSLNKKLKKPNKTKEIVGKKIQTNSSLASKPSKMKTSNFKQPRAQVCDNEIFDPSMLFAEFSLKLETQIKEQIISSVRDVFHRQSRDILTEELLSVKNQIEDLRVSVDHKVNTIENSLNESFREISLLIVKKQRPQSTLSKLSSISDNLSEATPNNIDEKVHRVKKIKKYETTPIKKPPIIEIYNDANLAEMSKEKKKRGRKPKSFHQTKIQENQAIQLIKEAQNILIIESNENSNIVEEVLKPKHLITEKNFESQNVTLPKIRQPHFEIETENDPEAIDDQNPLTPIAKSNIDTFGISYSENQDNVEKIFILKTNQQKIAVSSNNNEKKPHYQSESSLTDAERISLKEDLNIGGQNSHISQIKEIKFKIPQINNSFRSEPTIKFQKDGQFPQTSTNDIKYQHDADFFSFN
jgi:hypothetical protein